MLHITYLSASKTIYLTRAHLLLQACTPCITHILCACTFCAWINMSLIISANLVMNKVPFLLLCMIEGQNIYYLLLPVFQWSLLHSKQIGAIRVRKCPVGKTLAMESSKRFPRTEKTCFIGSKILNQIRFLMVSIEPLKVCIENL